MEVNFVDKNKIANFTENGKATLFLKHKNQWVDYCPCDGISLDDENSICSFITFEKDNFHYLITRPNLREKYQNGCSKEWKEMYNIMQVYKFTENDLYKMANNFNKSGSIYCVTKLEFNDESLFTIVSDAIISIKDINTIADFEKAYQKILDFIK